jgi:hypothetical protein
VNSYVLFSRHDWNAGTDRAGRRSDWIQQFLQLPSGTLALRVGTGSRAANK